MGVIIVLSTLSPSPTNLRWATARMDHKPVLHYRVLQLGLPLMLFLLTDPLYGHGIGHRHLENAADKLVVMRLTDAPKKSSCEGGLYLAGVDSFRFEQVVTLPDREPRTTAKIYLGNKTHTKDFLYCKLTLGLLYCPAPKEEHGCYCTFKALTVFDKPYYVITVDMPLSIHMANESLFMWYEPPDHPADAITLFVQPIPDMIDPKITLILSVDGKIYKIRDGVCPKFKPKEYATVKFCAWDTVNPTVVMHFDNRNHFEFKDTCGEKTLRFTKDHLGKTFWFSYKDSCRRHGTLHCRYPAKARASSVQMTKGLLGLLVLGCLMTYSTWS